MHSNPRNLAPAFRVPCVPAPFAGKLRRWTSPIPLSSPRRKSLRWKYLVLRLSPWHQPAQPPMLSLPARLFARLLQRLERRRRKRSIPFPRSLRVRLESFHQFVHPRMTHPQHPRQPERRPWPRCLARCSACHFRRACFFARHHCYPGPPHHPPALTNEPPAPWHEGPPLGRDRDHPFAAAFPCARRFLFLHPPLPHQLLDHSRLHSTSPRQRLPPPRRARLLDIDSPRRLRPLRLVSRPPPSHSSLLSPISRSFAPCLWECHPAISCQYDTNCLSRSFGKPVELPFACPSAGSPCSNCGVRHAVCVPNASAGRASWLL
jgi:hypothetical protein